MSNAKLAEKKVYKKGHILRMLERFGIINSSQAEEIDREIKASPSKSAKDILLDKGFATEDQINVANRTPSDPEDLDRKETTGEFAIRQLQRAKDSMDRTITEGIKLSDVAAAIAAKKVK